ncbi:MAG: hypothetical protein KAS07_03435 [Candidatus Pacebacteria bacterium]|nr:hypothetical protein [Candidatus Paceibacterota bacterium]
MKDLIKNIQFDVDYLTLMATISVAVLGWLVALILQRSNAKHQHKIEVRYDIYKQFVQLHKEIQDVSSKLGVKSNPPFILMDSCMIGHQVGLNTEQECVQKGVEDWRRFVDELNQTYLDYSTGYVELLYLFENWTAALGSLEYVKKKLCEELEKLKESTHTNLRLLHMHSSRNGQDWRGWDRDEVENIAKLINRDMQETGAYLHDFMVLIHNELLSGYFKKNRLIRKTLSSEYKVLTKKGFKIRIDHKQVRAMKGFFKEIKLECDEELEENSKGEYHEYLLSIKKEECPECGNKLEVMLIDKKSEMKCYLFTCGHSWEVAKKKDLLKGQVKKIMFNAVQKIKSRFKKT